MKQAGAEGEAVREGQRAGERDLPPVQAHLPHIDAYLTIGQNLRGKLAGDGADDLPQAAGFRRQMDACENSRR